MADRPRGGTARPLRGRGRPLPGPASPRARRLRAHRRRRAARTVAVRADPARAPRRVHGEARPAGELELLVRVRATRVARVPGGGPRVRRDGGGARRRLAGRTAQPRGALRSRARPDPPPAGISRLGAQPGARERPGRALPLSPLGRPGAAGWSRDRLAARADRAPSCRAGAGRGTRGRHARGGHRAAQHRVEERAEPLVGRDPEVSRKRDRAQELRRRAALRRTQGGGRAGAACRRGDAARARRAGARQGRGVWSQGAHQEGRARLPHGARLDPESAPAHFALGVTYEAGGWLDAAIGEYEAALVLRPDYAEAHNNVGILYAQKGMLERALPHFEAAVRLRPDDRDYRSNLERARRLRQG
ncbi:MAG: tetratricopeptide repeat protein [Candidatus Rokubacteria bacterium]|nr:tetratricopeptide repeat protein [Candidatus Rokubacteria bacterium]